MCHFMFLLQDVAIAAVTQNGRALEFVSDLLKTDHETVVAAVTQWRGATKFANHVLYDLLIKEV